MDTLTLSLTLDNQHFAQYREMDQLFALEEDNAIRKTNTSSTSLVTMKIPPLSIDQAHCCFGHLREANLCKLAIIAEIEIYGILSSCEACILAKITKTILRSPATRRIQIMDLFHNDLVGPITPIRYKKAFYFQMVTDDYSRIGWGWSLTSKAKAFTKIQNLHSLLKVQTRAMSIRRLRLDRAMEFLKEEIQEWMETEGIDSEPTTSYRPDQNGVAEQANCKVIECMRATFIETDLPKKWWPLVFDTTLYVKNRTSTSAISNFLLPIIYLTNTKPDLSHLHSIEYTAVYKIPDAIRVKSKKFEGAGMKCRFLDYKSTNFRLLDSEKVIVSSDVEFPVEKAKNFEERDLTLFVEPQVDELECILVNSVKAYQQEKRFSGGFLDEVDTN